MNRSEIKDILRGIDRTNVESILGWWDTEREALRGKRVLEKLTAKQDEQDFAFQLRDWMLNYGFLWWKLAVNLNGSYKL